MHLRGIIFFFVCHCTMPSQRHRMDFNLSAHLMHNRHNEMETDREGDSNGETRGVSVSYPQRPCSPLFGFSYFLNSLLCSGTLYLPKMSTFDIPRKILNNQLPFRCVAEQPGRILPIQTPDVIVFESQKFDVSFSFAEKCLVAKYPHVCSRIECVCLCPLWAYISASTDEDFLSNKPTNKAFNQYFRQFGEYTCSLSFFPHVYKLSVNLTASSQETSLTHNLQ